MKATYQASNNLLDVIWIRLVGLVLREVSFLCVREVSSVPFPFDQVLSLRWWRLRQVVPQIQVIHHVRVQSANLGL